jgi:hypothetical protein
MTFLVSRSHTLELSLPRNLRVSRDFVPREDFILAVVNAIGNEARQSIKCIQRADTGLGFRVTFKANCVRFRESLLTKGVNIKGTFCHFNEAESVHNVVTVSNLPFELDDKRIAEVFGKYGMVKDVIRNIDDNGFETGDRRLLMILREHIPAAVFLSPYCAHVKYRGQPLCCFNCNWWGHPDYKCHLAAHCLCSRCGDASHATFDCREPSVLSPP